MATLAFDDRIPTQIIDLQQALDISDIVLTQRYGQSESTPARLISENRGSSNEVKVYEKTYGGKNIYYAVRIGTFAAFKIEGDSYIRTPNVDLLTKHKSNTLDREEFLNESRNSEKNWKKANEQELSPELYFYGYIKRGDFLTLCTISEAFNMDLATFWSGDGGQFIGYKDVLKNSEDLKEAIASQLVDLFKAMVNKMGIICFDIKPQNTVIKFDVDAQRHPILNDNFVVKLIDWDADWCRNYPHMLNSRDAVARESFRKAATIAMIMVMANFFYEKWDFNILRDVMVNFYDEDKDNLFTITKTMMNLFESGEFGGQTTDFSFMAKHYFRSIHGAEGMTQEQFLHEMFKRSISLNRTDYNSKVGFILSRELIVRGGKKRRKTRRKYKRKTKRVQTKKRRRKSNIKKKRKTRRKKRISKKKRN